MVASGPMPQGGTLNPDQQNALLGVLIDRIVSQATGSGYPVGVRLSRDHDRGRLWLGMLASEPGLRRDAAKHLNDSNRILPPAQGFSFLTQDPSIRLDVQFGCAFYVSLLPTLDEQTAPQTDNDDGEVMLDASSQQGRPIVSVWSKMRLNPVSVSIDIDTTRRQSRHYYEDVISDGLRSATRLPSGAEYFRSVRRRNPMGMLPRDADLLDERTWARYCATNLIAADQVVPPEHRAAIRVDVSPRANGTSEVLVTVVNRTPAAMDQLIDGRNAYEDRRIDTKLYEVELVADTTASIVDYDLEQVGGARRYERAVRAFGHAGPVWARTNGVTRFSTTFAAERQTFRVYPRAEIKNDADTPERIDTRFDRFIADPIGAAEALLSAFERWVDQQWSDENLTELANQKAWDNPSMAEARKDAIKARAEVEWIRAGVEVLRANPEARKAFIAANRVMKGVGEGEKQITAWFPFQVAWIIGCLPGMVDPANNPDVCIVWFATGGGKSEAYLGLMLVTLFYGRYTGTTAGAQVWARFPLRLLALQQTERFAAMVLRAELVRRLDPEISGGDPFGIGFFAGGGNTPNKLRDRTDPYYRGVDPRAPETAEMCRILHNCPACGDRLEVRFDDLAWTMWHVCCNAACELQGNLPVWSVDDDIYRYAPSVLVGTVDKLAALGLSKEFQVLLGRVHSRCPRHGYRTNPTFCGVFGCQEREHAVADGFGHLRLEIADELHLLEESLGALDGMYETLLQAISERFGNPPMHIVGATATIEGYETQVHHLYHREARRFPENGPVAGETFWSYTNEDEPMRRYMGVRPRAGTMVTATAEVVQQHRQWAEDLCSNPAAMAREAELDDRDMNLIAAVAQAGREEYEVMVAYCLRTEDLNTITRERRVIEDFKRHGQLVTINGDSEPNEVKRAVNRLVEPSKTDDLDRVKLIAATKAIGHGFDVPRLGVMALVGTPTQAAEIIQASARVGRRHPGLVVNVANPQRDRDSSFYRCYAEWIKYLDRMVHKVPVNRDSVQVLRRLLSGGLMAWLLQVYDRTWITGGRRRRSLAESTTFVEAVRVGVINRDTLVDDLTAGFGIDRTSEFFKVHRDVIATWVEELLASIPLRAKDKKRLPELLHPAVPRSLRDVQEPLTIHGEI
ncbi:helicase-related protein [Nocardia gipuzkoensis]